MGRWLIGFKSLQIYSFHSSSKKFLNKLSIAFCFISNTDIDWYHDIPDFHSMHNKSEPKWEWEDEQGFSALRHSGETIDNLISRSGLE